MTQDSSGNKDLHFKGQYANEHVIAFFRSHWITLLPDIVFNFFFVAVLSVVFGSFFSPILAFFGTPVGQTVMVVTVFLISFFIHNFYIKLINYFLNTVIITNFRIVENQKIVFMKDLQISIDMKMIQDIEKEQNGILKNILNFGELIIMMSSSDTRIFKFVPNPNFHFRLINRLKLENSQNQMIPKDQVRDHQSILYRDYTLSGDRARREV